MNFYEKYLARQEDLKKIHERALEETPVAASSASLCCVMTITRLNDEGERVLVEKSVLRRGYKIQWTAQTNMYELFLTTTTDYYKYVDDTIIDEFLEKGFVRTADEHQIARYRAEIERYNSKIDKASSERNDSLMVHWRLRRKELIEKINRIEENLVS